MSDEFHIETATRKASPVSVFVQGVSGSGKTYSSLLLARGLAGPGEKIGIIDTEGGRSLIYADDPKIGGFEHMRMEAPFGPDRFIRAADAAVKAGWKAIVIDSMSLEHDGEGGLLEMADIEAERLEEEAQKRNRENRAISQQKWTQPKLAHKRLLNHLCGLPVHVLGCFRETLTTDFDAKDERGQKKPATILTVVAEKNTLFSFELHCAIEKDHTARWSRIPEPYLPAIKNAVPITVEMGAALAGRSSSPAAAKAPVTTAPPVNDEARESNLQDISDYLDSEGISTADFNAAIEATYRGKKTAYTDYKKLPTDHLEVLAKGDRLKAMADKAREIANGGGVQA
jgi:hypothetical protein